MIWTIALRELRSMFLSPLAWTLLATTQIILGILFASILFNYTNEPLGKGITAELVEGLYTFAAIALLLFVPLLTMRMIADDRRNQTLALLFSAPISMTEIVFGKYLGTLLYLLILCALILLMPLSVLIGGTLDFGLLLSASIGLLLLSASFSAIGIFFSTLTLSPALAAIGSFGAIFLLWMLAIPSDRVGENFLSYLSIITHYEPFLLGLLDTRDVVYYLVIIALFLFLSIRRLDAERLGA